MSTRKQKESDDEFVKFQDFAKRLVAVPKKEIDQRLDAERKAKQRTKKKE